MNNSLDCAENQIMTIDSGFWRPEMRVFAPTLTCWLMWKEEGQAEKDREERRGREMDTDIILTFGSLGWHICKIMCLYLMSSFSDILWISQKCTLMSTHDKSCWFHPYPHITHTQVPSPLPIIANWISCLSFLSRSSNLNPMLNISGITSPSVTHNLEFLPLLFAKFHT